MARSVTFIHAADLHLDAPFQGIDASDDRVSAALVDSTYRAFARIVDACIAREVDFLIVAGDAFNSRDKSLRAQLRFRAEAERLNAAGIAIYLTRGNHDPASGWSAGLELPDNVHYFATDSVERIEVTSAEGEHLCALYGRSYATAATTTNLARGFSRASQDENAIGVLHANVGGQEGYEPYAPCTLDDLRASGMDYWALGHIHKPLDLLDTPRVRYSGSPQGLNPKEDGPHGCWLVSMDRGQVTAQEFIETAAVRWARTEFDASEATGIDAIAAGIRALCDIERERAGGAPVVVRIDLLGRSDAHADLARGTAHADLLDDLRQEQLSEFPWVWIDRVRDRTAAILDVEAIRASSDFAGDLVRIADSLAADAAEGHAFVADALAEIDRAVGLGELDVADVLERARDICLDRLLVEEGS